MAGKEELKQPVSKCSSQTKDSSVGQKPGRSPTETDEEQLEKLAVEAILQEARCSKIRAEQSGAMGWQKCPLPRANKRFINNMVVADVASNKRRRLQPEGRSATDERSPRKHGKSKSSSKDQPLKKKPRELV